MILALLVITADDYGYCGAYDAGIIEAARAGSVDGVSVMAMRAPDPAPLHDADLDRGLHLEHGPTLEAQLAAFERIFEAPPAYLDGHHHCHARPPLRDQAIAMAARLQIPVRGVDRGYRLALRAAGVATVDRVVGRSVDQDPALPTRVAAWLSGDRVPEGITEWFVHPGHPDPKSGSSYDRGRGEDLELLLGLGDRSSWAGRGIRRATLTRALGA